jgi:hypothetical protein
MRSIPARRIDICGGLVRHTSDFGEIQEIYYQEQGEKEPRNLFFDEREVILSEYVISPCPLELCFCTTSLGASGRRRQSSIRSLSFV